MPLTTPRILHVYYINRTPAIVSAGRDLNILCSPLVELTAVLVPDGRSHTVEWVQLSGTVVELIDADTLTPYFINPNTGDLSFRVYIDRNKPYEVYDDVRVYRQPASRAAVGDAKISRMLAVSSGNSVQAGLLVIPRIVPTYYLNNDGTGNENKLFAGRNPPTYALEWTIPSTISSPHSSAYFYTDISLRFTGAFIQQYSTIDQQWLRIAYRSRDYDYFNLPTNDGTAYRLEAVWEETITTSPNKQTIELITVVPDSDSWGVFRSPATAPLDYASHVNTGGAMGDYAVTQQFGFSKTIFNPRRASYLAETSRAIGTQDTSTMSYSSSVFRVSGKIDEYSDLRAIGTADFSGLPLSLTIQRVSGISIG